MGLEKDYIDNVIRKNLYTKKDYYDLQKRYDRVLKKYNAMIEKRIFDNRALVLKICYAIPGYMHWPVDIKNRTYDRIMKIISEE